MKWQPIDTAPKHEWILLYQEDKRFPDLSFDIGLRDYTDSYWLSGRSRPTHWAPLPKPPKTKK